MSAIGILNFFFVEHEFLTWGLLPLFMVAYKIRLMANHYIKTGKFVNDPYSESFDFANPCYISAVLHTLVSLLVVPLFAFSLAIVVALINSLGLWVPLVALYIAIFIMAVKRARNKEEFINKLKGQE